MPDHDIFGEVLGYDPGDLETLSRYQLAALALEVLQALERRLDAEADEADGSGAGGIREAGRRTREACRYITRLRDFFD